jgi:hypothetical protein
VLQTERQRTDVVDLLGDTGNLEVVPNPLQVPAGIRRLPPDRLRGVVVSRLSALKRSASITRCGSSRPCARWAFP